jgi:hypothetical protein
MDTAFAFNGSGKSLERVTRVDTHHWQKRQKCISRRDDRVVTSFVVGASHHQHSITLMGFFWRWRHDDGDDMKAPPLINYILSLFLADNGSKVKTPNRATR